MLHWNFLWLMVASLLAGVMNAMAGGGSFLSFPAMLSVGVPPIQANATNTVALWPGQVTSLTAMRMDLRWDLLPVVATTSILGGVSGAWVLLHTGQVTFSHLIPWLMLGGTTLFGISGPVSKWIKKRAAHPHAQHTPAFIPMALALLPVCFYVGYFGAGGGFLIMTVLALFGVEKMNELNSMKVMSACLANLSAIVTFIVKGAVVWHFCLVAMIFAGVGGYLGARWARRTNPNVLRAIVVATGCVIAGYFFWRQS